MACALMFPTPSQPLAGSTTVSSLASADRAVRQARLLELMLAGHMPDRLRALAPVTVDAKDTHGRMRRLVLFVARDYLSVGTNDDAVRVPLDAHAAQLAVDALGCMLPTPRMVDLIWRSAQHLPPQPWGPPYGAPMLSAERALAHSSRVDARIKELGLDPGGLLAGHKKDVVLSNRLQAKPRSVAIYGWHNTDGTVIQPLSLVHESTYADYSHGVRPVLMQCTLDDAERVDLRDVLRDPALAPILSSEGPLKVFRQPYT